MSESLHIFAAIHGFPSSSRDALVNALRETLTSESDFVRLAGKRAIGADIETAPIAGAWKWLEKARADFHAAVRAIAPDAVCDLVAMGEEILDPDASFTSAVAIDVEIVDERALCAAVDGQNIAFSVEPLARELSVVETHRLPPAASVQRLIEAVHDRSVRARWHLLHLGVTSNDPKKIFEHVLGESAPPKTFEEAYVRRFGSRVEVAPRFDAMWISHDALPTRERIIERAESWAKTANGRAVLEAIGRCGPGEGLVVSFEWIHPDVLHDERPVPFGLGAFALEAVARDACAKVFGEGAIVDFERQDTWSGELRLAPKPTVTIEGRAIELPTSALDLADMKEPEAQRYWSEARKIWELRLVESLFPIAGLGFRLDVLDCAWTEDGVTGVLRATFDDGTIDKPTMLATRRALDGWLDEETGGLDPEPLVSRQDALQKRLVRLFETPAEVVREAMESRIDSLLALD